MNSIVPHRYEKRYIAGITGINTWEKEHGTWEKEQGKTDERVRLKNRLASKDFSINGVTGKIHFQGDRKGKEAEETLLKVELIKVPITGYEIVPQP